MMNKLQNATNLMDNLEIDKALPLIYSLINDGVIDAYALLAYAYEYQYRTQGKYNKKMIKDIYQKYYDLLEQDFNNGNLKSGMKLAGALRFFMANYIERDDEKALRIYKQCASSGLNEAKIILAEIYKEGDLGVKKDMRKYFNLLKSAAIGGSIEAMHELGIALLPKNSQSALFWIQKAAEAGYWQSIEYLTGKHSK